MKRVRLPWGLPRAQQLPGVDLPCELPVLDDNFSINQDVFDSFRRSVRPAHVRKARGVPEILNIKNYQVRVVSRF